MDSEIYLGKLVKLSIRKRNSPKIFLSLLTQLIQKEAVSDNELLESLIEVNGSSVLGQARQSLQLNYAIQYAFSGAGENARFMKLLSQASLETQRKYILYFKNNLQRLSSQSLLREFINDTFLAYTRDLSDKLRQNEPSQILRNVWTYTLFLWGNLIDRHSDLIAVSVFKELGIHVMATLNAVGNTDMVSYFSSKANVILNTSELHKDVHAPTSHIKSKTDVPSITSVKKSFALNMASKKVQHYIALKRFIWLNTRFRSWELDHLVERYFQFFKILTQKVEDVIEEIVRAFVGGIIVAIKLHEDAYVVFNWRNFIVTRLPQVLKESRVVHNQGIAENVGEILVQKLRQYNDRAIAKMTSGGLQDQPYDLRKQFMRSCVYSQVVSLDAMLRLFPEEGENVSQALITHQIEQLGHVDGLNSDMHSRLLDINAELTSLEESRLVDGFQGLATSNMFFLAAKQARLHELVHHSIDTLTREKSVEKLARLVLALASALPAANYVFFHDGKGPFGVLDKVIAFIDGESFGVDADDSNFQEVYAQFGALMSGVILLSSTFGVEFDAVCVETSYTVEYINRFFYRLAEDLTDVAQGDSDEDRTIVRNYNRLMGDWTNALFDPANDGLSDDLIKSVNVKQIYKLLLVIFQLAINAKLVGALASAALDNGIDYLLQNFLAPCAMAIMYWAAPKIGPMQPATDAAADVLLRIIEANTLANAQAPDAGFRVVLNAVGRHILRHVHTVPEWQASDKLALLARAVERHLDPEYCRDLAGADAGPLTGLPLGPATSGPESALMDTVRHAVLHYTANPASDPPASASASASAMVECWRHVRVAWPAASAAQVRCALVAEVKRVTRPGSPPGAAEEARIFADFVVFLVANSAALDPDGPSGGAPAVAASAPATVAASAPVQYRFAVTVDNHYASMFNDPAPEPKPKDADATDLDMDDLFNDVGDDLFGDLLAPGPVVESSHACRTPATAGHCYREVRQFVRVTAVMAALLAPAPDATAALARLLLAREADRWARLA